MSTSIDKRQFTSLELRFSNLLSRKYPVKSDLETAGEFKARMETFDELAAGIGGILISQNPTFSMHDFWMFTFEQQAENEVRLHNSTCLITD